MTQSWELKLKIINLVCQGYFILFTVVTLLVAHCITLPEYCDRDEDLLLKLESFAYFLFFNMTGNYICIRYKSRLSVLKSANKDLRLLCTSENANFSNPISSAQSSSTYSENRNLHWSITSPNFFRDDQEHSNESLQCVPQSNTSNGQSQDGRIAYIYNNQKGTTRNQPDIVCEDDSGSARLHQQSTGQAGSVSEQQNAENVSSEILGGWKSCSDCQILAPPRSKHCPLCKVCILKHDHHCFFAGCCVGFHNQRFFALFCLFAGTGGIYSYIVTSSYLHRHYEALETWGIFAYLVPTLLIMWITGNTKGYVVAMVLFFYWTVLTTFVCCYYFGVQVFLIFRGQTKYECLKGIKTYRCGARKSFLSVFGKYWFVGLFFPAPFLGYQGDGINWNEVLSESKIL